MLTFGFIIDYESWDWPQRFLKLKEKNISLIGAGSEKGPAIACWLEAVIMPRA